jgi:hypothetical protein
MNTFTKQITSATTINITPQDGVISLSAMAGSTGVFNFLGSFVFQGLTPSNLVLSNGQGITITAPSTNSPLSGITIEWVSGTVELVISVS